MRAITPLGGGSYSYAGIGYANPHAVSQIANGLSTTTYSYDQNGNVVQKTTDGVTTTYLWDYANRLIALGSGGATTTYSYDAFGARVFQSTATTRTLHPFKWYSVASSTGSGATYATTTEYVFNGDTLVSTIDQQLASGVATGTAQTRYIHPDHLGSTNVVTDASGTAVQTIDYYPYGATQINSGQNAESRQYIGQFVDPSSLLYLQARYMDPSRGQFLSEDPIFLGEPGRQNLKDPQSMNSYSYANENPITGKDPNGKQCVLCAGAEVGLSLTAQATFDATFGPSSNAVYGGDIVAASLYGFAYPWTLVAPEPVAAVSAAAGNVAQQGLEYISGDLRCSSSSHRGIRHAIGIWRTANAFCRRPLGPTARHLAHRASEELVGLPCGSIESQIVAHFRFQNVHSRLWACSRRFEEEISFAPRPGILSWKSFAGPTLVSRKQLMRLRIDASATWLVWVLFRRGTDQEPERSVSKSEPPIGVPASEAGSDLAGRV